MVKSFLKEDFGRSTRYSIAERLNDQLPHHLISSFPHHRPFFGHHQLESSPSMTSLTMVTLLFYQIVRFHLKLIEFMVFTISRVFSIPQNLSRMPSKDDHHALIFIFNIDHQFIGSVLKEKYQIIITFFFSPIFYYCLQMISNLGRVFSS